MENSNRNEMDVKDLIRFFTRNIKVFVLVTAVCALLGFLYSKIFIAPTYTADILLCIKNTTVEDTDEKYLNQTDIIASYKLVNPCIDIIKSNNVMKAVASRIGDYTEKQIRSMISFSTEDENQIFRLKVTCNDPQQAQRIANTIADVAPEQVTEHLGKVTVSVIDRAELPSSSTGSSTQKNVLIFGAIGFFLCYAFYYLKSFFDIYIRSEDDLSAVNANVPVLGTIPAFTSGNKKSKKRLLTIPWKKKKTDHIPPSTDLLNEKTAFFVKEAYKDLRTNILFSLPKDQGNVVAFVSSVMSEGKSTTCLNTAISFAEIGKKVLVIDTDMRRPRIHRLLKSTASPGLSNLLLGMSSLQECVFASKYENLDVIFAGDTPPNPAELLSSPRFEEILHELSKHYDYLFIDTPAVAPVTDTVIISKLVTGAVYIVREGVTDRLSLQDCMNKLAFADIKILGFVVNDVDMDSSEKKAYKHKYRYKAEYK